MMTFQLTGLRGFSFKKGVLNGTEKQYPVATIQAPFITLNVLSNRASSLLTRALLGLAQDKSWCVKNSRRFRYEIEAEKLIEKNRLRSIFNEEDKRLREALSIINNENQELKKKVRNLERAIETMMGIKSSCQALPQKEGGDDRYWQS